VAATALPSTAAESPELLPLHRYALPGIDRLPHCEDGEGKGEVMNACLEHTCLGCQFVWFDNNVSKTCPMCGSKSTQTLFDEDCDDVDTPDIDYDPEDDDDV
jgi:hypothetical protein